MITSTANGKVKRLINLKKKRKLRDEEHVFLVEGIRMFREVPVDELQEVYVSESFYKKEKVLVNAIAGQAGVHIEVLTDTVFAHASDTKTPQGILLVMEQRSCEICEMLDLDAQGRKPLLMVLDNLQDPGNLGTILRAGEAAGVTGVIMSHDCVDIYNPKVIRSTMGSVYRMPFVYVEHLPETLEVLAEAGIHSYAAHLKGKNSYDQEDYTRGTAFLIGNEGNGLRDEVADAAECYIKIPMCGEVESLNAAVASSVLMFEAARQRR